VGFDNFSYIVYSKSTKEAAIIDPSYDVSESIDYISSNKLELKYIINTHHHSDHTSKNDDLKKEFTNSKIIASKIDAIRIKNVDIYVSDNDQLKIGDITLKFILTPGHTPGGLCIIIDNEALITGDTLFIGDCGRCDLRGGSLKEMYETLQKIKKLDDKLIIYPGHDYGYKPYDTLGNQKKTNKVLLAKSLEEFSKI
jgi:glyoxylase-like metal-dependent hydrolase (beta-lactamase superfamily II)